MSSRRSTPQISFHFDSCGLDLEIKTEHLYIRSYREVDYELCVKLYGDKTITQYFDHGQPRSRLEVDQYILERGRRYFDKKEPYGLFSIFEKKEEPIFMGQVDLLPTEEPGILEIGCILHKHYHNQGLGTEAVRAILVEYLELLIQFGFTSKGQPIKKILGTVHPENALSNALIKKLGFVYDRSEERFGNPRLWFYLHVVPNHDWHAEDYHLYSSIQYMAAQHVLQKIDFMGNERVLDIGRGDGKITAEIANLVSNGSVLGIDLSEKMINFARKKFPAEHYPNLSYLQQDGQGIEYELRFDLIFSSFALQWLLDHPAFLQRAYKSLAPRGYFVATIPLGISSALEQSITDVTSSPEWSSYFHNFSKKWQFTTEHQFKDALLTNQFHINHIEVVNQEMMFPSQKAFEQYVLQWFPYLRPLPEPLQQPFFKQIMRRYLDQEIPLVHGEIRFRFPRLDVIALKVNP